ncbi:MAG: transcription antitermination factor NusB, partial [Thermoanaerobaculia bacterium]
MRGPHPRKRRFPPPAAPRQGTLARRLAVEAILDTDGGRRSFIDLALEARLEGVEIPERDRHLLQEIAYGAVRHRSTLDHLLESYLRLPMKRQEPPVRWALRVGAYQVVYLSRIPAHAAIHRTIDALKELDGASARSPGFVNAVLRKLAADVLRKGAEPPVDAHDPSAIPIREGYCYLRRPALPLRTLDPVGHVALKHSHPRWLVERWLARFGEEEAVRLCEANNRIPQVTARITRKAPGREAVLGALAAQGCSARDAGDGRSLVLGRTGDPRRLEPLKLGWIQIQDPTASAIGLALDPPEGARVLDLCAAPGGKAAQLLEQVGPAGSVVACDIDEERFAPVREN